MKSRQVCNKTRSPPAWRLFKGQGSEHTTVKLPIGFPNIYPLDSNLSGG